MRRWRNAVQDVRCDIDIALKANHILVTNEQRTNVLLTQELVRHSISFCLFLLHEKLMANF